MAHTAGEYGILHILSVDAGRVTTSESLLRPAWDNREPTGTDRVRAFVKQIRAKLGDGAADLGRIFAALAILSSDKDPIYALLRAIGGAALAPSVLTPTLPVWVLVGTAIIGIPIWVAGAMLRRRRTSPIASHRQKADWGAGFWLLALLWLPVLVSGAVLIQYFPSLGASPSGGELRVFHSELTVVPMGEVPLWVRLVPEFAIALFVFSPAGLAVALLCRQLWRLGYSRTAWTAGAAAALANAALLALATGAVLFVTTPESVGSGRPLVVVLYLAQQQLPVDMPVDLAAFNLPLLAAVLRLGRRNRMRKKGSGIDGAP